MTSLYLLTWKTVRTWLLGGLILLFVVGVFILMHTGQQIAPMGTGGPSDNGEDFGQYLVDHQSLLAPFFDKNHQNLVTSGEPLLLRVMGDVILLNMAIGWVLAAGIAFGFSSLYAPLHAKPWEAVVYSTWRVGLDIIVFLMGSFAAFGWEQLNSPIPVVVILILFVLIDIQLQSFLVANVYGTTASVSMTFYVLLLIVLVTVGALVSGAQIKKRIAIMMSQFADVPSMTADLLAATAESTGQLNLAKGARDDAQQAVATAQDKLDKIHAQQDSLRKDIEAKKQSEPYVYGRIIRTRATGDLTGARDQMIAFLNQFPKGKLLAEAKAQLDMVNQDIATQAAQKKQAEIDAATAAAQAKADLQARAAKGEVTLEEMRKALLGKVPDDVTGLFGQPTMSGSDRWGYSQKMVLNPITNEKLGLAVYFIQGTVQSVDYFYGN